jgi:polyisoprenoid-binding protein YceI
VRRPRRIALASIAGILALAIVAPAVYGRLSRPSAPFVPDLTDADGAIAAEDLEGSWEVADASEVGYRVREQVGLTKLEATGRTTRVDGAFLVEGGLLVEAAFEVDMATFASDRSQRDQQFRTRIMDATSYPTARFSLADPVALPASTDPATMRPFPIVGELTLRGVTRPVTIETYAAVDGGRLRLTGATEIVFADWGIPNPSLPVALIFTDDRGTLEFDLRFSRVG